MSNIFVKLATSVVARAAPVFLPAAATTYSVASATLASPVTAVVLLGTSFAYSKIQFCRYCKTFLLVNKYTLGCGHTYCSKCFSSDTGLKDPKCAICSTFFNIRGPRLTNCSICQDRFTGRNETLTCGHTFCLDCLKEYFVASQITGEKLICKYPKCEKPITKTDQEAIWQQS